MSRHESNEFAFREIFRQFDRKALPCSPRGMKVLECENFMYVLPSYVRFCNFKSRNLKLQYIKNEFLWYLKGDKFDQSILEHASLWKKLVNSDGSINSNYGQYVFGDSRQFDDVIKTLINDQDSRRASIVILADRHLKMETNDVPCTYSLNFRIRNGRVNMTVHMRSQDAIFGMGNDAPTFSFIHEMIYNALLEKYPSLELGEYCHVADSFHVYERHFEMLKKIVEGDEYIPLECPKISGVDEVRFLRACDFSVVPENYLFTKWLLSKEETDGK